MTKIDKIEENHQYQLPEVNEIARQGHPEDVKHLGHIAGHHIEVDAPDAEPEQIPVAHR